MDLTTETGAPPTPTPDTHETVASFTAYPAAQQAMDLLADKEFDVRDARIVGHGMTSVEIVTGRMTNIKATILGALTGAWFGLFVGLLLGLFAEDGDWLRVVSSGIVLGAAFGAMWGLVTHLSTRGRRDFMSARTLVASRYDVMVPRPRAAQARAILAAGR